MSSDELLAACPRDEWFRVPDVITDLGIDTWNRGVHIQILVRRLCKEKKWNDHIAKEVLVEHKEVRWCI
jgi:hypothetical protein